MIARSTVIERQARKIVRRSVDKRRRWPLRVLVAGLILLVLLALAVSGDYVRPLDTRQIELTTGLQPPSVAHPMGTDMLGRDLFAMIVHGLRISFTVSVLASFVAMLCGAIIGALSGSLGGRADQWIMRAIDVFQSQNHFLFGILVVVLFRPVLGAPGAIMLSVGLTHWVAIARIVRGELLSLREQQFVAAAINSGASRWRIVRRHFIPHLLPSVALAFVLLVPHAIFHESGLSFLGLGMPPHQASLGNLLADSRQTLLTGAWWTVLFPGAFIFMAAMAIGVLGDYWRDRSHPRWRSELEL